MKTSGHLILYISENEDFELWRVLAQISPEDRAAFVKAALKKAVLNESRPAAGNWAKKNNGYRPEIRGEESPVHALALETLGYDETAAQGEEEQLRYSAQEQVMEDLNLRQLDEFIDSPRSTNKKYLPGLDFLMNQVIGEEDDEQVRDFIRKNKGSGRQ